MTEAPGSAQLTELEARYAALRQAARSKGAEPGDMLDAAFAELEGEPFGHGARVDEDESAAVFERELGDGARFGIVVDELCGHQQVVVKSIEESYGSVPGIAGATILGNGRVAFILDIEKLSDLAGHNVSNVAVRYADAAATM